MNKKKQRRPSHTRPSGVKVINTSRAGNPSASKLAALREIISERAYAKIDGCMIDLFTASTVLQVYDALSEANKATFLNRSVQEMSLVAYKVIARIQARAIQ